MRTLVQQTLDRAIVLLERYRTELDEGARRLIERETLLCDELPVIEPVALEAPDPPPTTGVTAPVHA